MMRKHKLQDMVKMSLYVHRDDYNKVVELSGDMSMNLFMARAVKKAIEETESGQGEQEQKGVSGSQATNQREAPAATPTTTSPEVAAKTNNLLDKGGPGR